MPPEALSLEGFNPILANFYSEAKLDELWKFYQPDYERGVESLRAPVSNLVFTVTNYLREIIRSSSGRSFSVYVEPLAGDKTIFKTFGDQYALVVRPSTDPPMDDIRHAFLHFLLDPIAIRYRVQASRAVAAARVCRARAAASGGFARRFFGLLRRMPGPRGGASLAPPFPGGLGLGHRPGRRRADTFSFAPSTRGFPDLKNRSRRWGIICRT